MKYVSIGKKIAIIGLMIVSINQQFLFANPVKSVSVEQKTIEFDRTLTDLMSECLFNLEVNRSFKYYCDIFLDLAEQNKDILSERLQKRSNKNIKVEDFLNALKKIKGLNNAMQIGIELLKYVDALPVELQEKLKKSDLMQLRSNLALRLKK